MIILSFLLQLLLNNYINYNSYFYPLFPLIILAMAKLILISTENVGVHIEFTI